MKKVIHPKNSVCRFSLRLADGQIKQWTVPHIMGIINRSPSSFYNPVTTLDAALYLVEEMIHDGADWVDIGGQATNPFVDLDESISINQELELVVPTLEAIKQRFPILVSIDTSRPAVMQAALDLKVDMINDQQALRASGAMSLVAKYQVPVCLMHFFRLPRQPNSCTKAELLTTIMTDLKATVAACLEQGISAEQILLDPGFGQGNYGKNTAENFYLLSCLPELVNLGFPVLTGWSRKSMIGDVLGKTAEQRLFGSIAANVIAAQQGAAILRVHDVAATRDAMAIWQAYQNEAMCEEILWD